MSDIPPPEEGSRKQNPLSEIEDQIEKSGYEILKEVPEDQQEHVIELAMEISRHAGPLPSPKTLALYKDVMPDLPERIVRMAEKEGDHRRDMEEKLIRGNLNMKERGQWFGLIIAMFTLGIASFLIMYDHPISGGFIGIGGVCTLVAIFVTGKYRGGKSRQKKDEEQDD